MEFHLNIQGQLGGNLVTFSEAIQTLTDNHQSNINMGSYVKREASKPESSSSGDTAISTLAPTVLVIDRRDFLIMTRIGI